MVSGMSEDLSVWDTVTPHDVLEVSQATHVECVEPPPPHQSRGSTAHSVEECGENTGSVYCRLGVGGEFAPRLYKLTYARNHAHIHTYQTKSFLEEGGRFQMGNDMEYQRGTSTVEGDPLEDLPGTFQPLIPPPGERYGR